MKEQFNENVTRMRCMTKYILHLMPDSVYSVEYSNRINSLYGTAEHKFYIYTYNHEQGRKYDERNVEVNRASTGIQIKDVMCLLRGADAVFLHSLFLDRKAMLSFARHFHNLNMPIVWVVWGGDLVKEAGDEEKIQGLMLKKRLKRWCRCKIIGKLSAVVSYEDDYQFLLHHYETKARRIEASYSHSMDDVPFMPKKGDMKLLAGHSANFVDRHIDLYRLLAANCYEGEVYSVLSYDGEESYVKEVISEGFSLFKDRYHPITEWMGKGEYVRFLSTISIAVFMGDRQSAVGNILLLLGTGAKVYADDYGIIPVLKREGAYIPEIGDISSNTINRELSEGQMENNRKVVQWVTSDECFKMQWDEAFVASGHGMMKVK